ncbi:MAG: hypothetical protein KME15_11475 [Drouetiella hepatica Uher 2000/2452]|jgi:hypothetical protein|uniref:SPOR domain-containing protein n=1 Tax=Drouetiella hepatica Uher 2000/2452 TaxID=904376 RepID=A0A951UMG3_9CYAN|nr:hypothetical protein [Drouetiella hepatica Uher 2000/2452]
MPHNTNPDGCGSDFDALEQLADRIGYRDRLNHWAVIRLLPNMQRVVVGRFRSRSDADGHQRFLQQHVPEGEFIVLFDSQQYLD